MRRFALRNWPAILAALGALAWLGIVLLIYRNVPSRN